MMQQQWLVILPIHTSYNCMYVYLASCVCVIT